LYSGSSKKVQNPPGFVPDLGCSGKAGDRKKGISRGSF
jgi:hypothetical protein